MSIISRLMGGNATDTEDDLASETNPFPRALPQPSLLSDSKLPSYNRSSGGPVRRTWAEGQWATGRAKSEKKGSKFANTLICVLIVASVPLIYAYMRYGKNLATFGDHSSMLPWLTSSGTAPHEDVNADKHGRVKQREVMRADEQEPWRQQRAQRAVQKAEAALAGAPSLKALTKSLVDSSSAARTALGGGSRGRGGQNSRGIRSGGGEDKEPSWAAIDSETVLKYKAAEREVHALEGKVGSLERRVMEERIHARDSQSSALTAAQAEIARLEKSLTGLEVTEETAVTLLALLVQKYKY